MGGAVPPRLTQGNNGGSAPGNPAVVLGYDRRCLRGCGLYGPVRRLRCNQHSWPLGVLLTAQAVLQYEVGASLPDPVHYHQGLNSLPRTSWMLKTNMDKSLSLVILLSNCRNVPAAQFLGFAKSFFPLISCISLTLSKASLVM
mgnify:CR=1 FL=1